MEKALHQPDELTFEQLREENEVLKKSLAEERVKNEPSSSYNRIKYADDLKLLHELQVYQVEMEMQNEELRSSLFTQEELEIKHEDLFEFAPNGYFTLDLKGVILKVNLTGATLSGIERGLLVNNLFLNIVEYEYKEIYIQTFQNLLKTKERQICEVKIYRPKGHKLSLRLAMTITKNTDVVQILIAATDITYEKQREETQAFLLGYSWSKSGHNFFEELAEYLYKTLGVDYVCIDKLMENGEKAETVAIYFDGKFEDNVSYTLADTPCGKVSGKQVCCFANKVRDLFPKDEVLQEMVAESYAGITLWSSENKPIGLIAVIGRMPLVDISFTEQVLKQISIRAASELEHRQAEEALRESEERFSKAFNSSPMGFNIFHLSDGKSVISNEAYLSMIGYSKEEVIGHSTLDLNLLINPEDGEKWMTRLRGGSTIENLEIIIRKKSGEMVNLLMSLALIDIKGETLGLIQVVDITKRKKAEKKLAESEELFRTLAENIPQLCWMSDANGFIFWYNQRWYDYTGTTPKQMEGWGWKSVQHPDYIDNVTEKWTHALKIQEPWEDTFPLRCNDGEYGWFLSRAFPIHDENGKIIRWFGTNTNITELKKAEEKLTESEELFRALAENIPQLCWMSNADGWVFWYNQRWYDYTGTTLKQMDGWGWQSVLDPKILPTVLEAWNESITNGKPFDMEFPLLGKDGEFRSFLTKTSPIYDPNGVVIQWFGTNTDITELKKAEDLLRASEERYRSIFMESLSVMLILNPDTGRITNANQAAGDYYGFSIEELCSKKIFDINTLPKQEVISILQKSKNEGTNHLFLKHRLSNGDVRDVEVYTNPIEWNGKIVLFVIIHDITESRKLEEKLRESVYFFRESQRAGFIGSYKADFLTNSWESSEVMDQILGIDQNYYKDLKSFLDMIYPEDTMTMSELMTDVALSKGIEFNHEFRIIRKNDGETRWVHGLGKIRYDENQKAISLVGTIQDITKRKQHEESITESEQRLKFHFENSPLAVVEWDSDFMITQWSNEAEHIFGYTKEETIGKRIDTLKLIFEEDIPIVNQTMERLTIGIEQKVVSSNRDVTKTGEIIETVWYNSVLLDKAGKMISVISLVQDITLQKKAEEALFKLNEELETRVTERTAELQKSTDTIRLAEEKYRTVANFASNWEFWMDPKDVMLYCSPSCKRVTGYSASEFEQNSKLIYDIIHPEDIEFYRVHLNEESNSHHCNHEIQFRIIRKDGTVRWIGHFCQPIYDENHVFKGTRGSNKDITLRKKTEELLRDSNKKYNLLSENISDGIFICRDSRFEYVNKAVCDIFGYSNQELEGFELNKLVTSDYGAEFNLLLNYHSDSNQTRSIEVECNRNDSTKIFVEILFKYVTNDDVIYGVIQDITERKRLQRNILKAIIETEEKERSYFSKELHDGLGPLLSTIKLYLQWSQRPNNSKSIDEIINKAEDIIEEALTTVKEISNKLSPHLLTNYGLSPAIKSFVNKLQSTSTTNIEYVSNFDGRLDFESEASLYRVIIECINNSLKHASASHISINLNENDGVLNLTYTDNGIGFDVPETISNQKGLGLFNLQNRIKSIGGKFTMDSKPGEGVKYQFMINV